MVASNYAGIVVAFCQQLCDLDIQCGEFGEFVLGAVKVLSDERSWPKDTELTTRALNQFFEAVQKGDKSRAHTILWRWGIRTAYGEATFSFGAFQCAEVPERFN